MGSGWLEILLNLKMIESRVIPVLLMANRRLVKTRRFSNPIYVGDPLNTVRIFNNFEADEIVLLDILASRRNLEPDYGLLATIASECFVPISYGGGIRNLEQAKRLVDIGFERVSLNSSALQTPGLITEIADYFGSQAVVVSIDARVAWNRSDHFVVGKAKNGRQQWSPLDWAKHVESLGAGEILLTSVTQEGTREGFDIGLTRAVSESVGIPTIANGGAGTTEDLSRALIEGRASGVAASTMFLFQREREGVVLNYRRVAAT